jgi:hypothetical protein
MTVDISVVLLLTLTKCTVQKKTKLKLSSSSSRNNQQYAQICTTALFHIPATTCFGSSLPSSGNFWTRLSYMKIQFDLVVYHTMLVKWPVYRSVVGSSVVLLLSYIYRVHSLSYPI